MDWKQRLQELKLKKPAYGDLLSFYGKVKDEQEKHRETLQGKPLLLTKDWRDLLAQEGFPWFERKNFSLDPKTSAVLFGSLCRIAKEANPFLSREVRKVEEALEEKRVDVETILKDGLEEHRISPMAETLGVHRNVLAFLIQQSLQPWVVAAVAELSSRILARDWSKGICPICGSLPYLSLLREEVGKRFLVCSFCGHPWRTQRLLCPFCSNNEQGSLRFFYAEEDSSCRIDLCDACHQYMKTIDARVMDVPDPPLEDLATLHLDLLALEKGYRRPVPNLWIVSD